MADATPRRRWLGKAAAITAVAGAVIGLLSVLNGILATHHSESSVTHGWPSPTVMWQRNADGVLVPFEAPLVSLVLNPLAWAVMLEVLLFVVVVPTVLIVRLVRVHRPW